MQIPLSHHRNTHKHPLLSYPLAALLTLSFLPYPQLLLTLAQTPATPCFNQAGIEDPSFLPCNSSSALTEGGGACCRAGDTCWSNGLCRAATDPATNKYYYDGCTDPTWAAPGCVSQCLNVTTGNGVQVCPGGGTTSDGELGATGSGVGNFCCLGFQSSCDCTDEQRVVRLDVGTVVATLSLSSTGTAGTSPSPSPSSSPPPSATTPAVDTSGTEAATTITSNTAPNTTTSSSPANDTDKLDPTTNETSSLSTPTRIGIGVAASLAAAGTLAFVVLFLLRRRRRRQLQPRHQRDARGQLAAGSAAAGPAELHHSGGTGWPSEVEGRSVGGAEGKGWNSAGGGGREYGHGHGHGYVEVAELHGNGVRWMNEKRPVEAPSG